MSHRLAARLLAVALTTAALGVPAAAHADRVETRDASGDVMMVPDLDTEEFVPAPDFTSVDILRTVVDHRANRLNLSVRFRDLRRTSIHTTIFRVVTPKRAFEVGVYRGLGGGPQGLADVSRTNGRTVKCTGLRWSIDRDSDRVTASIPSTCLGSPRWVRIGAAAVSSGSGRLEDPNDGYRLYADDGHRAGSLRERLAIGPKVSRG